MWNIVVVSSTRKVYGYPLGDSLGAESGSEGSSSGDISGGELEGAALGEYGTDVLSSGDMSCGNGDDNIEVSTLGDKLFGSEFRTKICTSVVISDGKVGYSVGISVEIGDGNLEGSPLGGKSLGADGRSEIDYYNFISHGSGDVNIEGYTLGEELVS